MCKEAWCKGEASHAWPIETMVHGTTTVQGMDPVVQPIPYDPSAGATLHAIPGMGPDAPTTVNARGGKQSALPYRFDLLPPLALAAVARVLEPGAKKYGEWNWLRITTDDNLNHALAHSFAYVARDASEGHPIEHLRHAACRVLMALEIAEREAAGRDPHEDFRTLTKGTVQ